ncbi:proheparin-binding EGF-like growth factor [Rhincodon typus]|uniref:proheparin-binding EGF-like growth factor n=1 Tax=Rhincodon typus TaxID=259920 RepID=UPI0009A44059|nr:proheparin-binding EGF-like growth factor [Rhincodon typus]
MRISIAAALLVLVAVSCRTAMGAAIEGYESELTRSRRRGEADIMPMLGEVIEGEPTVQTAEGPPSDRTPVVPEVALYKPAGNSSTTEVGKGRRQRKNRRGKRKGKKNPCYRKYKDFCIHGECHYLKHIKEVSCRCFSGYEGVRCGTFILAVEHPKDPNDNTTTLAIVAVVLSSLSLTVILILLVLGYHRRVASYDVKNEEKIKLGNNNSH